MGRLNIQTAIKRLRAHKNNYCEEKFVKGASIHEALDIAITALEETANNEEYFKRCSAEIFPNLKRYAHLFYGEYKGKFGVEHIVTIVYKIEKNNYLYYDNTLCIEFYPLKIKYAKAKSRKRLIKKAKKIIERLDAEILSNERRTQE